MKKLIYLGVVMSMIFVSCDKESSMNSYDWEGAYTMETTIEYMYFDGTYEFEKNEKNEILVLPSEMNIYKKMGKLYVQTQFFNIPDTMQQYIRVPKRITQMTAIESTLKGDEQVVVNDGVNDGFYLLHGLVFGIKNGIFCNTLPIQVKSFTLNKLTFNPSSLLYLHIINTDFNPNSLYLIVYLPANCQYLFGDMNKNDDKITWDITLILEYPKDYVHLDKLDNYVVSITYHNVATKK